MSSADHEAPHYAFFCSPFFSLLVQIIFLSIPFLNTHTVCSSVWETSTSITPGRSSWQKCSSICIF